MAHATMEQLQAALPRIEAAPAEGGDATTAEEGGGPEAEGGPEE